MAGGGVALIGTILVPLLSGLDVKGYGLFVGFLLQWVSSFRVLWWYARRRKMERA